MANPTTNYGWPMPTTTDLVTDLPADFAAFGQPVDTSLKALNPETTLGDIAYRSSTSNTNTRLGIGSTGQVLTVAGGVPTWATPSSGGMTLLNGSGTTLSGSTTTISVTVTGYTKLKIYLQGVYQTANSVIQFRINGDTGNNYSFATVRTGVNSVVNATTTSYFYLTQGSDTVNTDSKTLGFVNMEIFNPTSTDFMQISHSSVNGPSGDMRQTISNGMYDCTAALSSVSFICNSGSFSGGTAFIYGVK